MEAVYDDEICNAFFDWDIEYDITDFKVTNNGHSIVLQAVQESNIDAGGELDSTLLDKDGTAYEALGLSENTIARFPNYFLPEGSPHDEFCFHSMHFHWGRNDETGSEHFVDGHQYPLELHFVHFSCAHASLGTTLGQFASERNVNEMKDAGEDSHQLGVVGIFFDVVEDYTNPAFEALLNDDILSSVELPGHEQTIVHNLNIKDLLPEDIETDGYYAYEGSLTTPPCTNIVRWHVMNGISKIGVKQMEKFRELKMMHGEEKEQIAPNYREIQNNVNKVYGCMSKPANTEEDESTIKFIVWIIAVFAILTPIIMGVICCKRAKAEHAQQGNVNKTATRQQHHST